MGAPGRSLLHTASILLILFGGICIILAIIALLGSASVSGTYYGFGAAGVLLVSSLVLLLSSGLYILLGALGLKKCSNPRQYVYFIVTGIVLCVLSGLSLVTNLRVETLIGLALPVLYIVGGNMNKKAAGRY